MLWMTTRQFRPLPFEKASDLHSQAWVQTGTWFDRRADPQHKRCADNHTHSRPWCSKEGQNGGALIGICTVIVAVALVAVLAQAPQARAQTPGPSETRELVIGTKVAPPFAIKAEDGTWHGISIDLWRHIADQIHLRYRFQETTLKVIDGVSEGSLDAAVAALTVTGPRHRVVDFTQPFYSTGLGIAVASDAGISWWAIIRNVFSLGFFRAAAVLFAISLSVGVILWLIERRHNEHFGPHRQGLGASIWWSAAAMTQIGGASAGGRVPKTLPGRLLAMVWMVTSVIVFVSLTAALTSQLTLRHLRGPVNGQADLRYVRVGAIAGTETTEYLGNERIAYQVFADGEAALSALQKDRIDALVYDRPLLLWLVNERFSGSLRVLNGTFDPQAYAIALPQGSELRIRINLALLDAIRSDWWRETLFEYLGPR